jgi:hypothetical protein
MDLAPLLYICRAMEQSPFLLLCGFLLTVPTISMISAISTIDRVDFPIVLLLLSDPLATWFKEPSLSLEDLDAYIINCE